ncbi:MAG: preprotein translocase subunit YajC [Pseudomonadota bacterium]
MSFFISDALAAAAPAGAQEPGLAGFLFPLAILVAFYLLFLRPQAKRSKEHKKMVDSLTKGTEVVTNGGLLGKIIDIDENFVQMEVSDSVHVQVQRRAIASMMPKGTYKAMKRREK